MNSLDLIILILIAIPAALGYRKGFLKSIFSLGSIILGIYLGAKFHSGFSLILQKLIKDERILDFVSFALILIITYLTGMFIASKLAKINTITKTLDKILGLTLGIFKGWVIALLVLVLIKYFSLVNDSSFRDSFFATPFAATYDYTASYFPSQKKNFDNLNPFIKKEPPIKK